MYKKIILLIFLIALAAGVSRLRILSAIYYNNRGTHLLEQGDYKAATQYFNQSLKLMPGLAETHYNLGAAFAEARDYENAIKAYEKALELKPNYIKARYNLAILYYEKLSMYEEAAEELKELLRIYPDYGKAAELLETINLDYSAFCLNSGLDYLEEGRFREAEEEFNKVLSVKPDFVVAKYNLALLYLKKGETEKAKLKLREVIQQDPGYAFAYRMLGSIYFNEGNYREAEGWYREMARLRPDDTQAYNDLAQTHTKLEEYDKAIGEFHKALSIKPDNLTALYGLASTYRDKGDYQNAIFYYKKLQALSPDYPFVEADLAGIYGTIGRPPEPRESLPAEEKKIEEEKTDTIYLKNGRIMRGIIIKETERELILRIRVGETEGQVTVSKGEIGRIEYREDAN